MRLRIVRAVDDKWLPGATGELDAQFGRDCPGNFILDRKDVVEFPIGISPIYACNPFCTSTNCTLMRT